MEVKKNYERSSGARLDLLATLSRRAEDPLRNSPDCLYQDTDSVCMRDSEESRKLISEFKKDLNDLYGKFGMGRTGSERRMP
jgi:hypothetical protein